MADFMELALYDEHSGYYSAKLQHIGYRGDFSTGATMSTLLARRLVAAWRQACDAFGSLPIIEIGGGNGDMAINIAREIGFWGRLKTRYYMVDRSPGLRQLQAMVGGNFVRVYATPQQALAHANGKAFIFSNELPDAFPARQFIYRAGHWLELGLSVAEGRIIETARPCSRLPQSTAFARWAQEGQVVEVHDSYHRWYGEWQENWVQGTCITIDYGEPIDTLYYRRPLGTLRGYKAHTLLDKESLIALAGQCDITADVNFTDLHHLATQTAGDIVQLTTQRDFLLPYVDATNPADQHLVATPGAGDHFQVLIQHRFAHD